MSKIVTNRTSGHADDIDVDIRGTKRILLEATEAGDGYNSDWCAWAEPRFVGPKGKERKLTELQWTMATAGWGEVLIGKNAAGDPLRIDGKEVSDGIGFHAPSSIEFDVPAGFTRFKARGGLDDGGANQSTSVQFRIYSFKRGQ